MNAVAEPKVEVLVPLRRRLAGIAIVVGVVLLQLLASYIVNRDLGRFVSVLLLFAMEMPPLMLTLTALFKGARRQERSSGWLVAVGLLVAAAIGGFFGAVLYELNEYVPGLGLHTSSLYPVSFLRSVFFGVTQAQSHFGLWTLAFVLPLALEDARVRKLEAEQLRSAAELSRLRANLEPHFLLNTLNAIAGLVIEDPKESRRLLAALGDLLRDALSDEGEVQTLGAQMTWLRRYAQILEARHRGDLRFEWQLEPGLDEVELPRLLIQPLVENAVKHGALKRETAGRILVRVERVGGARIRCTVEDDGPGLDAGPIRSGAFGVQSVRRRLELRYGSAGTLSLEAASPGTRAIVEFPGGGGRP
jgi:signal transduction histidine kinase